MITLNSIKIGIIFIENLNKPIYSRSIEEFSDLNIRTIVYELKNLLDLNILDYNLIGKTKVYFLKNTLECKFFLNLVENYRTNLFISNNKLFKLNLLELYNETNFLIFGSFANKKNDNLSDLDLVIFSKETKKIKKIIKQFPIKVQVQWIENEKEFKREYKKNSALIIEILKKHILFGDFKEIINLIIEWKKEN